MIVSVSGKIGSGKDTVGSIIQYLTTYKSYGYTHPTTEKDFNDFTKNNHFNSWKIVKWADKLKDMVCILLSCTRKQLEDRVFKETPLGEEWTSYGYANGFWSHSDNNPSHKTMDTIQCDKETYEEQKRINWQTAYKRELTPRLLMQLLGTECGRNILHPNVWVTSTLNDYKGDIEIWKDIIGYESKYQISNFGRVKGLDRKIIYGDESKGEYHTKKESILKSTITGHYEMIKLEGNNSVTIHSLVANHFIPKIENKNYINHIDQNPLNNFYKNLEWCTQSENILSANKNGNGNIGSKQADAKLTEQDVIKIKEYLKNKTYKQNKIAELFNISTTTISDIKHGRKWAHIGNDGNVVNIKTVSPILPINLPNWIITDTRFPNEADAVKSRGGINIRLQRNSDLDNNDIHVSETALDFYKFDYVVDNNGTIEDLIIKVKEILIKEQII